MKTKWKAKSIVNLNGYHKLLCWAPSISCTCGQLQLLSPPTFSEKLTLLFHPSLPRSSKVTHLWALNNPSLICSRLSILPQVPMVIRISKKFFIGFLPLSAETNTLQRLQELQGKVLQEVHPGGFIPCVVGKDNFISVWRSNPYPHHTMA